MIAIRPEQRTEEIQEPSADRVSSTRSLRIGALAVSDPRDVSTWSGVPFFMIRSLEQRFGPVTWLPAGHDRWVSAARRANRLSERAFGRRFIPENLSALCRMYAREIERHVREHPIDICVAITVDQQLACLDIDVPVVHLSDSIFSIMEDYYPQFSDLWSHARARGHEVAKRALETADVSIFPSHWAADAAFADYGADPATVHVVPYGANLLEPPSREIALPVRREGCCRLLFAGGDWERKGGPVVLEALGELRRRGVDCALDVVGCRPRDDVPGDSVRLHPFLNKQVPEERKRYEDLWRRASFFVMPSRQETFGAVYCEAAAWGVPVLATRTGGVADAVAEGVSGYLLSPDASGHAYADRIEEIWSNTEGYRALAESSRSRFEQTLNWSAWADRVAPMIEAAAANGRSS